MGGPILDPTRLTASGEHCLVRLAQPIALELPAEQLVTVISTVVEAHVSRILARLVMISGVDKSALGEALLAEQERSMNDSWHSRQKWLTAGFGVAYAGRSAYQDFDVVIQARNAVVHGDGAVTRQQRARGLSKLLELRQKFRRKLEATVDGHIRFGPSSGERAMEIARTFVVDFDELVLERYPEVASM